MNVIRDNKIMKISKIQDKVELLEVRGRSCGEDCREWAGNSNESTPGCHLGYSCKATCLF